MKWKRLSDMSCHSVFTQVSASDDYFFVEESAKGILELIEEYDILIRLCRGKEND